MDPRRSERFADVDKCSLVAWPNCVKSGTDVPSPCYSPEHIRLQDVRRLLEQERRDNPQFRQLWAAAEKLFEERRGRSPNADDDTILCLIAYTIEEPVSLYRDFNKKSKRLGKSESNWKNFPCKGWWYMLHYALSAVPSSPARIYPLARIPLYRGVQARALQGFNPDQLENDILYSFNHFTSTSTSKEVALFFAGQGGLVIEFDVVPLVALGIKDYSACHLEDEVLLGPWSTFEVVGVRKERGITYLGLMSSGPTLTYKFD